MNRLNPESVVPYIFRGAMLLAIVGGARAINSNSTVDHSPVQSPTVAEGLKADGLVLGLLTPEWTLTVVPNLTPQRAFPGPTALLTRRLDSAPTPTPALPLLSLPVMGGGVFSLPVYDQVRLQAAGIDTSKPENFANFNIAECLAPKLREQPQSPSRLGRLAAFLERQLVSVAEAASYLDVPETKQDFLTCIKRVEKEKPFFSAQGFKIDDWTQDNVVGVDTIANWRTHLTKELKARGLDFSQDHINSFLGKNIPATFRQADGTLGIFTALIVDTETELKERQARGERGVHLSGEKVWVVKVGDQVLAVFQACDNAFVQILTPKRVALVTSPTLVPATATPVPPVPTETPRPPATPVPPTNTPVPPPPATETPRPTIAPQPPLPTATLGVPPTETPRPVATRIPTNTPITPVAPIQAKPTVKPQAILPTATKAVVVPPTETPRPVATRIPTSTPPPAKVVNNTPVNTSRPTIAPGKP